MIPFRMLNRSPSNGLHASGLFPEVTQGHSSLNYDRLQAHRRSEELNGALRRNDTERIQTHYALNRPQLIPRKALPTVITE